MNYNILIMEAALKMEATNAPVVLSPEAITDVLVDIKVMKFLTEKTGYSNEVALTQLKAMPYSVKKTIIKDEARLQYKRDYYKNVVKPKQVAAKQAMQMAVLFEEV